MTGYPDLDRALIGVAAFTVALVGLAVFALCRAACRADEEMERDAADVRPWGDVDAAWNFNRNNRNHKDNA